MSQNGRSTSMNNSIEQVLSGKNNMNLTKRRLTPAQIANLESLRRLKETNNAKLVETKAEIEKERERVLQYIPKAGRLSPTSEFFYIIPPDKNIIAKMKGT